MKLTTPVSRRSARLAAGAAAVAGALLAAAPLASALPPNCTAADMAGVASGVSAATSAYLFTHPDVNAFFTGLEGQPREAIRDEVQSYLDANPVVRDQLTAIRQPLADISARCGSDDDIVADVP